MVFTGTITDDWWMMILQLRTYYHIIYRTNRVLKKLKSGSIFLGSYFSGIRRVIRVSLEKWFQVRTEGPKVVSITM